MSGRTFKGKGDITFYYSIKYRARLLLVLAHLGQFSSNFQNLHALALQKLKYPVICELALGEVDFSRGVDLQNPLVELSGGVDHF